MPLEMLSQLPELLRTYEMRWDKAGGLLFFSQPCIEERRRNAPHLRWKIVFNSWIAPQGEQMRFSTATKVSADAMGLAEELP